MSERDERDGIRRPAPKVAGGSEEPERLTTLSERDERDGIRRPAPKVAGGSAEPERKLALSEGRPAGDARATVEEVVRSQLSAALGGVRGVAEAAVPTIGFTATYVITEQVRTAVGVGVGAALVLVAIRVAQRSEIRFVLNSLFGILIAAVFAARSGKAEDAFLPGIIYNSAYSVLIIASILVRRPLLGFLVGAVTQDQVTWRSDPAMLRLCSRLTCLLAVPCVLRVAVQYPLYEAGQVGALGTAKVIMGWPLQVAALFAMGALLARGRTPLTSAAPEVRGQ